MTARVFNFAAGPATLPQPVLQQAQSELLAQPGLGISALEVGHRTPWFKRVLEETTANLRQLLKLPGGYHVIYLQGGSRLQFSMIPMNLLRGSDRTADYVLTGSWGKKAIVEARREGEVHVPFDAKADDYTRVPLADEPQLTPGAAYVHITSNETIQGVQFQSEPKTGEVPLICDCSSDFLSRPLPMEKYGLIYACAQKNLGPAGVTVVVIRDDLLECIPDGLHSMLDYRTYVNENSLANTPPVFAIYIVKLVTAWLLEEVGGLEKMQACNEHKASLLYEVLDRFPDLYQGHAQRESRSKMNVTFRLPGEEATETFIGQAAERGLYELKGHRSVGGIRASIYNAMPTEGVEKLRDFMVDFAEKAKP